MLNDLRYALRLLRRSPAFALAAIATLAIGIGATTAIFAVFERIVLNMPANAAVLVWAVGTGLVMWRLAPTLSGDAAADRDTR